MTVCAMTGLQVAPTAPCSSANRSSSREAESFHKHVGVVCVISWRGLFQLTRAGRGTELVISRHHTPAPPDKPQRLRVAESKGTWVLSLLSFL